MKVKYKNGFSLIETVVYLAVVTLVLGVIMNLYFTVLGAREEIRPREIIEGETRFSLNKIIFWTRRADAIISPSDQGEVLKLEMEDEDINPVEFEIRDKRLVLRKGGKQWQELTTDRVEITNLVFRNLTPSESPGVLRTTLRLKPIPALGGRPEVEVRTTTTLRE